MQPSEWQNTNLGKLVEIKRGGSPRPIKDYLSHSGLRWLKISDVTGLNSPFVLEIKEHIKKEGLSKTVFLKKGALILSNSATPGIPKILDVDSCIHDGWLYFSKSELSKYYGVTTDTLLGLSEGEELDTEKAIRSAFIGLDRKEAVLKAFEIERAIIPAIFDTVAGVDDVNNNENVFPSDTSRFYRSQISIHDFFQFTASSEDVNLAVTLLRNKKILHG